MKNRIGELIKVFCVKWKCFEIRKFISKSMKLNVCYSFRNQIISWNICYFILKRHNIYKIEEMASMCKIDVYFSSIFSYF